MRSPLLSYYRLSPLLLLAAVLSAATYPDKPIRLLIPFPPGSASDSITAALTQVKAGKMKAIAIASARRSPAAPDIPTVAEQGYPGFDATLRIGVFAPAATPREIVEFLAVEINRALAPPTRAQITETACIGDAQVKTGA